VKSRTPLELVRLILLGTFLINLSWLLDFLPFDWPKAHEGFWASLWTLRPVILIVGVFVAGVLLIWRANKRLSAGIIQESWTEDQLTAARKWSDSPALGWCTGFLLFSSLAILVLGRILHFRWNVLVPIYSTYPLNWMKTTLRKPPPPREPEDWHQRPRFFSSHWGEPPADRSGNSMA
jgi:hypothetical protein